MKITEIRIGLARTIIPPGGDRYQPVKLDAGVVATLDEGDDPAKARAALQVELRAMLEETYRAQVRPAAQAAATPLPANGAGTAQPPAPGFRAASPRGSR